MAPIVAARKRLNSYEMTTAMPGGNGSERVMEVKLQDGKPVRMRSNTPNGFMLVMTDKQVSYLVDTQAKTAMKRTMEQRRGGPGFGGRFFDPEVIAGFKPKVSSTKLDNVDCWLVQWTDGQDQQRQMWVDKKYGLPRQSQTPQGTIKFSYSKINAVPDSDFELPSGLTVKEAPTGRGGWGGGGPGGPGGWGGRGGAGGWGGGRGQGPNGGAPPAGEAGPPGA
jgi:outer membrane lipoprotein-sorting protein